MTTCEACKEEYRGKLEDHLTFHTTDPANTARYLAHLEQRISALEHKS